MEAHDRTEIERDSEIVVFSILKPSACVECGEELWKGSFLRMDKGKPLRGPGSAGVSSTGRCSADPPQPEVFNVVGGRGRFSRSRGRYERQGLLVESAALERAQQECLSDEVRRRIAREKASLAREEADRQYVAEFRERIRSRYPGCPEDEAVSIATHACEKYSGRVGRSSAAKAFDAAAIDLAVNAHVRHRHTEYDRLLSRGWERTEARAAVGDNVREIMERWSQR